MDGLLSCGCGKNIWGLFLLGVGRCGVCGFDAAVEWKVGKEGGGLEEVRCVFGACRLALPCPALPCPALPWAGLL
jgi:hypothetical protein